ncbi:MAG: hypothetical protein ACI9EF_002825, partial [Pseudohongiellaceae bacterium]
MHRGTGQLLRGRPHRRVRVSPDDPAQERDHGAPHGRARIIVLAKPPRRGQCKSRLAADVGDGPATRLARAMLADVWSAAAGFAASPGGEPSL